MSKKVTRVKEHLHRYKRVNISGFGKPKFYVYKCTKQGCSHFIQKPLVIGREAECGKCGNRFIMTAEAATLAIPRCINCKQGRVAEDVSVAAATLLSTLLDQKK